MPQTPSLDPMTAPLQEVLDWLAEADGWTRPDDLRGCWAKGDGPRHEREIFPGRNPITLGRLAGMLEGTGWVWGHIGQRAAGVDIPHRRWAATANKGDEQVSSVMDPTELEARARVVAAVKMRSENV